MQRPTAFINSTELGVSERLVDKSEPGPEEATTTSVPLRRSRCGQVVSGFWIDDILELLDKLLYVKGLSITGDTIEALLETTSNGELIINTCNAALPRQNNIITTPSIYRR